MPDFSLEEALWRQGKVLVAGVDEAGRGPLAGPVVVAAVVLPHQWPESLPLDDSKRLTPEARARLYPEIRRRAVAVRLVAVSPADIDRMNILQATLRGMAEAVAALHPQPHHVLVDGNRMPALTLPAETVVKGDRHSITVAAASIVAKEVRDRLMRAYARKYPQWGFERHKGYGTRMHIAALTRFGPCPIHRRTFKVKGVPWFQESVLPAPTHGERPSAGEEKLLLPGF